MPPRLVIVDGQQRLTSLYAVVKSEPVLNKNFKERKIRIAFHPKEERFEVTNPAIEQNPQWIPDISILWKPESNIYQLIDDFLHRLRETRDITEDEKNQIINAITRVERLLDYPVTALEVSSSADEEQVAEIFVRINSKGTPLNQADFILTLMSVFWDDGRKELEEFCQRAQKPAAPNEPSPYNAYLQPTPDQLLRVGVALGFRRAQLEYVYSLLRGKDLQTLEFSAEQRERQFAVLRQAQAYTLDLQHWHEFFKVLRRAGYPSGRLITSQMSVLFTYALWLIGKRDFNVDLFELRELMARWFFMASLTGRYTASPESRMEQDMALLRGLGTPEEFVKRLDAEIDAILTPDYWEVTLPNQLQTAAARSTGQSAYFAALCLLEAPVLYSKMKVEELLAPVGRAKKTPIERHHLFPRKYLQQIGVKDEGAIRQVANFALVEWSDNVAISDRPPREYVPELERRFTEEELERMYKLHALPERWYEMEYEEFLKERRRRIAEVIRQGFAVLRST